MPYNPAGLFSLVASYFATAGSTIRTEQHNPVFEDVASALSSVLVRDGRAPMTGPLNMNGFTINNIAPGNSANSIATLSQAMPIGAMIDFAGSISPSGWMLCYGQAISRATYAALFDIIGTSFGVGDGSTTFNLPDLRGRVVAGLDTMGGASADRLNPTMTSAVVGAAGGSQTVAIARAGLPNVPLSVSASGSVAGTSDRSDIVVSPNGLVSESTNTGSNGFVGLNPGVSAIKIGFSGTAIVTGSTGSLNGGVTQQGTNNVQPTMVLNKIIRVSYDG